MRFASISMNGMRGLAAETESGSFRALFRNDSGLSRRSEDIDCGRRRSAHPILREAFLGAAIRICRSHSASTDRRSRQDPLRRSELS